MLTLFGAGVWWLPRWLARVLPHVNIEGEEQPAAEPDLDLQPWLAAPDPAQPDGDGTTAGQPTGKGASGKDGSGA
jgi:hypothetical protein